MRGTNMGRTRGRGRGRALPLATGLGLVCSLFLSSPAASAETVTVAAPLPAVAAPQPVLPGGLTPVDAQDVDDMNDLTWDDFNPIPNTDWANPAVQPTVKKWKAALVLVDYPDMPFLVTQPQGSTKWGNPGPAGADIPRDQVGAFYRDMFNKPQERNNFHTINEYWMEDTGGRYGVEIEAFGPYKMPKKSYQYFYSSYGNSGTNPVTKCPAVLLCNGNIRTDALAAWKADTGKANPLAEFDNVFYMGASVGQSSTWLEFGEMMFNTPADVTDAFGPPQEWKDAVVAATGLAPVNWAPTRYVPWTSWASSASMWANASGNTSIESEADGPATFAHEFSHNLSIGDNYGNPYAVDPLRDQAGPYDMMSRGHQNGPGGAHKRWTVPSTLGDVMGSHHMLRDKMFLKTVPADSVVDISRSDLAAKGTLVTQVTAREVQLPGRNAGVNIKLDGGDLSTCASYGHVGDLAWMCDKGGFDNYTLEVVDQMGSDSFQADSGLLISKTKNSRSPNKWVIDANPQDMNQIDYYKADGTPVKFSRGDHRQLNDAMFKAGAESGSEYEWFDAANKLHLYVLDVHRDTNGILSYTVAARSTDGAGTQTRGVSLGTPVVAGKTPGQVVSCTVPLTNTGTAGSSEIYNSDVYRLSATATGAGWTTWLPQEIATASAGGTENVVVYGIRAKNAANTATLKLTATSESDATKKATVDCAVKTTDTATPGNGIQVVTAAISGSPLKLTVPGAGSVRRAVADAAGDPIVMNPVTLSGRDQITSGTLHPVGITDARGTASGWTLTGQASDFAGTSGVILATNLGWRPTAGVTSGDLPTVAGQGSVVVPGAVVVPGNGLDVPRTLCRAEAGSSAGSFTCGGGLDLGIPGQARIGAYTGLVTLTLI